MPTLRWVKRALPHWNASVREGLPRHIMVVGHEEGWAEVWQLLGRWMAGNGDHANHRHGWDDLHPASPTRQIASIQLSGMSDYVARNAKRPIRGVSNNAPCRVCFQPGKDVMVPGYPGIMDYPDDDGLPAYLYLFDNGSGSRKPDNDASDCERIARAQPYLPGGKRLSPRRLTPRVFFSGAVQTKTRGPGLYEPSRLVLYACHKNASANQRIFIRQTESVTVSVSPWEIETPIDPMDFLRHASFCVVPEGKIGSYGHRSLIALMMGCVPLITKERFSFNFFHEVALCPAAFVVLPPVPPTSPQPTLLTTGTRHTTASFAQVIDWARLALHVPPADMPRLVEALDATAAEAMREAAIHSRRRLLWASIYGSCHLAEGEGGAHDAFDTLMQVMRRPRRHFALSEIHEAPRAPEMMDELYPWLRERGGGFCTKGYQCFDRHRRSCYEPYTIPNPR